MAEKPLAEQASLPLFAAILLPAEWHDYLASAAQRLERLAPAYARWVKPSLLHLTLVFLGYQPAERRTSIDEAVSSAAASSDPFELGLGELGIFGPPARPRVIWNDVVDRSNGLQPLHLSLSEALAARGIPFDQKPLRPHITLGRAHKDASRDSAVRLRSALATPGQSAGRPGPFMVNAISLMQSHLSPRGPDYVELERFSLQDRV